MSQDTTTIKIKGSGEIVIEENPFSEYIPDGILQSILNHPDDIKKQLIDILSEQLEIGRKHIEFQQREDQLRQELELKNEKLPESCISADDILNEIVILCNQDHDAIMPHDNTIKCIYTRHIENFNIIMSKDDPLSYIQENLLKVNRIVNIVHDILKRYELEKEYRTLILKNDHLLEKIESLKK
jgi:hypothetical protein